MKSINKSVSMSIKLTERRELRSVCNYVIEKDLKRGRLKRPGSMQNLRRWLMREVLKREGWTAGRERLMKAAAILLMLSGLFLLGAPAAQAATFTEVTGVANHLDSVNVFPYSVPTLEDIDGDGDMDAFVGDGD